MKRFIISTAILMIIACGQPGKDGSGCSVRKITGGAVITCSDGTSTALLNGESLDIKPFCPDKIGYAAGSTYGPLGLQERYIKQGTSIYAILDSGGPLGVYLTLLSPGPYTVSDGSGCRFTVNSNGEITEL